MKRFVQELIRNALVATGMFVAIGPSVRSFAATFVLCMALYLTDDINE